VGEGRIDGGPSDGVGVQHSQPSHIISSARPPGSLPVLVGLPSGPLLSFVCEGALWERRPSVEEHGGVYISQSVSRSAMPRDLSHIHHPYCGKTSHQYFGGVSKGLFLSHSGLPVCLQFDPLACLA